MKQRTQPTIRITSRHQLIQRIKHELERRGYPRLQMMLIVALTGGAGFLGSFALLAFGVDSLALRYPLAVGIAYLVFLLLLWLWLRTSSDDYADVSIDVLDWIPDGAANVGGRYKGGRGQFGGGGSSGHCGRVALNHSLSYPTCRSPTCLRQRMPKSLRFLWPSL